MNQYKDLREISFMDYLFKSHDNQKRIRIAAVTLIVEFTVFKYFYPQASFIHGDSFVYLETAYSNLDINSYMVGYSRFLRLFSVFSSSDLILTAFQYLVIQISALYFLFTIFYFNEPTRFVQWFLFFFILLNPLFLYLGNLISSDGIFLALSLIWFACLLHILHKPETWLIICSAFILFVAFTMRYNALIYPIVSFPILLLSKQRIIKKLAGLGVAVILCGFFVIYTGNKFEKLTRAWQYSPFGGWLMANNAMYTYRFVDSASRKPVPLRFRQLDNMIRTYFDTSRNVKTHPAEALVASTVYMWSREMPLYRFRDQVFKDDSTATDLKKWASMGPLYKAYGLLIIKMYPLDYMRHFLLPNAFNYYAPPVEFLSSYNSGTDSIMPIAQIWFRYKQQRVDTRYGDASTAMLVFYPVLAGITNVVFICGIICFLLLKGFKQNTLFRKAVIASTILWIGNAGFTILASPAALRFQAFPVILIITFSVLLLDWICLTAIQEDVERRKSLLTQST